MNIFFRSIKRMLSVWPMPYLPYMNPSFSQDGEDVVLRSFYDHVHTYKGFFVDIGAHHPFRYSNTYLFYRKGWKGINVDASPGSMRLFKKFRKRDINLEIGIGAKQSQLTFYCFNEPALNTFDREIAKSRDGLRSYRLINEVPVKVIPLKELLDSYLSAGTQIDFLSIDAEGFDYDILQSNDWAKYKPKFILVEMYSEKGKTDEIADFLLKMNYTNTARLQRTIIFQMNDAII
jgi:FkbM family methyltransferase